MSSSSAKTLRPTCQVSSTDESSVRELCRDIEKQQLQKSAKSRHTSRPLVESKRESRLSDTSNQSQSSLERAKLKGVIQKHIAIESSVRDARFESFMSCISSEGSHILSGYLESSNLNDDVEKSLAVETHEDWNNNVFGKVTQSVDSYLESKRLGMPNRVVFRDPGYSVAVQGRSDPCVASLRQMAEEEKILKSIDDCLQTSAQLSSSQLFDGERPHDANRVRVLDQLDGLSKPYGLSIHQRTKNATSDSGAVVGSKNKLLVRFSDGRECLDPRTWSILRFTSTIYSPSFSRLKPKPEYARPGLTDKTSRDKNKRMSAEHVLSEALLAIGDSNKPLSSSEKALLLRFA